MTQPSAHHGWWAPAQDTDVQLSYISRQPIFGRALDAVGYELCYRSGTIGSLDGGSVGGGRDLPGLEMLGEMVSGPGLNEIVGDRRAFVAVSAQALERGLHRLFEPRRVVLQLPGGVAVDEKILTVMGDAHGDGYTFCVDHPTDISSPLARAAQMVRLDAGDGEAAFRERVRAARHRGTTVIASNVGEYEQLRMAREAGADLFQGFFFARPAVLTQRTLAADRAAATAFLTELHRPDVDLRALSEIIRSDLGLTFRLLRIVNSAFYALRHTIESVHQAVALLGLDTVRNLASLIALVQVGGKPSELLTTVMVRARMCEHLAQTRGNVETEPAFLTGLLSLLDALMDAPLDAVVERMPLTARMTGALLGRVGDLGQILSAVEAYERDDVATLDTLPFAPKTLTLAYLDSVAWALTLRSAAGLPEAALA